MDELLERISELESENEQLKAKIKEYEDEIALLERDLGSMKDLLLFARLVREVNV